jgi:hypothetical protein
VEVLSRYVAEVEVEISGRDAMCAFGSSSRGYRSSWARGDGRLGSEGVWVLVFG